MATTAYTTVARAIERSISHDEIARAALDETLSGMDDKIDAIIAELEDIGLDGHCLNPQPGVALDAWGTDENGNEWRIYAIDGLTQSVNYAA